MRDPCRPHLPHGHDQEEAGGRWPRLASARWRLRPSAGLRPRRHGPLAAPGGLCTHFSPFELDNLAATYDLRLTTCYLLLLTTTYYLLPLTTEGPRAGLPRGEIAHAMALRARRAAPRRGLGHRRLPRVHLLATLLQVRPPQRSNLTLTLILTLTPPRPPSAPHLHLRATLFQVG